MHVGLLPPFELQQCMVPNLYTHLDGHSLLSTLRQVDIDALELLSLVAGLVMLVIMLMSMSPGSEEGIGFLACIKSYLKHHPLLK